MARTGSIKKGVNMAAIELQVIENWVQQLRQAGEAEQLAATNGIVVRTRGAVRTRGIAHPAAPAAPKDALAQVVATLQETQHPDVRREVVLALGQIGGAGEAVALAKLARSDADPTVRAAAVEALGRIGGVEALQVLRESALGDGHEIVRARAVVALGELAGAAQRAGEDTAPVREALEEVRDTELSAYVREMVMESLGTLK
jgi:HEAT repeat protein